LLLSIEAKTNNSDNNSRAAINTLDYSHNMSASNSSDNGKSIEKQQRPQQKEAKPATADVPQNAGIKARARMVE